MLRRYLAITLACVIAFIIGGWVPYIRFRYTDFAGYSTGLAMYLLVIGTPFIMLAIILHHAVVSKRGFAVNAAIITLTAFMSFLFLVFLLYMGSQRIWTI